MEEWFTQVNTQDASLYLIKVTLICLPCSTLLTLSLAPFQEYHLGMSLLNSQPLSFQVLNLRHSLTQAVLKTRHLAQLLRLPLKIYLLLPLNT